MVDQFNQKKDSLRGKWSRSRWIWLALAAVGVVMTPAAVINVIDLYRADHRLGFVIPLGLSIRFAQIYGFTWLWWKTRPMDSN
jgi:Na+/H+ antiporter NhaA